MTELNALEDDYIREIEIVEVVVDANFFEKMR